MTSSSGNLRHQRQASPLQTTQNLESGTLNLHRAELAVGNYILRITSDGEMELPFVCN